MKKKHERNSKTHFEQVPLEDVKRIAKVDDANDEKAGADLISEPVSGENEPRRIPARDRKRR